MRLVYHSTSGSSVIKKRRISYGYRSRKVRKTSRARVARHARGRHVVTRIILEPRVVPFGTVLDARTTNSQNCKAVSKRARIAGS